jgi:DNA-binding transcriptional MerR regulator
MSSSGDRSYDQDVPDGQPAGRPVYSIGAVSKMLGVPTATLRTWQERYAVVVPERSEGGHRLYTRDQVEHLRFLVDQLAAGLSPADGHRLLQERLAAGLPLDPPDRPEAGKLLILLAERDPFAAEFSEYFLRTEGYDVALVMSVADASAKAAEVGADLAVIDLLISGGRGLELCRLLRERDGVPVLAVSSVEMRDAAMAAGASAFLRKPIEPLQLVSVVQDLLGRSAFLRRPERGSGPTT